jgi:hypothetical protein
VRFKARSQLAAILALLGALVGTSPALANDYSVDFGVETKAGKDAGSLTCQLDQTCSGELESLGLRVSILLYGSPYDRGDRASIHLNDRDFSCCYFEYLPHDGVNQNNVTGKTYADHWRDAGFNVEPPVKNQGRGMSWPTPL